MTVEGLLAESQSINNFRLRQVEKCPQQSCANAVIINLLFLLFPFSNRYVDSF